MKTLAFISGKGGTGKTSLTAAFAELAAPTVVADCDVDASDLALILPGTVLRNERFESGVRAEIDADACAACGVCQEACRFDAVRENGAAHLVEALSCEGCGVCQLVCEFEAVHLRPNHAGWMQVCESPVGPLVRGELRPAQSNSGKLVARVREVAVEQATKNGVQWLLIDGPPGIGCPVHASVTNVDTAVVITEPTPSGTHDLERAMELLRMFSLPCQVVINKADLAPSRSAALWQQVEQWGGEVVGELPFSEEVPRALAHGKSPLEVPLLRRRIEEIWQRIR